MKYSLIKMQVGWYSFYGNRLDADFDLFGLLLQQNVRDYESKRSFITGFFDTV